MKSLRKDLKIELCLCAFFMFGAICILNMGVPTENIHSFLSEFYLNLSPEFGLSLYFYLVEALSTLLFITIAVDFAFLVGKLLDYFIITRFYSKVRVWDGVK